MSSIILMVVAYGGQYDEEYSNPLLVSHDEAKLEAFIAEKRAKQAELVRQHDLYYDTILPHVQELFPSIPYDITQLELIERPSWIGVPGVRQVITDEMRAERAAIETENERRRTEFLAPANERSELREMELARLRAENGISAKAVRLNQHDMPKYRIDEIAYV